MLDWLVIGGGVHGTLVSRMLLGSGGCSPAEVRVLDPWPRALHRWWECTENVGMDYLRSSLVHHLDEDPMSLEKFARTRATSALDFYGQLFDFELRSRGERSAFIDLGDQFIALFTGDDDAVDQGRHFGLVVDDPDKVRTKLIEIGVEVMDGPGVDFRDPWGNYWQMVTYEKIQFAKTPGVMQAMGIDDWQKTEAAKREIEKRGFA